MPQEANNALPERETVKDLILTPVVVVVVVVVGFVVVVRFVIVVVELCLRFACERREWEKKASELYLWCIYVLIQARIWKGLLFNSRKQR